MPQVKRRQNDTMLYTLITFVGLFIVAATIAVVFYVKFERQRKIADESKSNLREMVTDAEWRNRGTIVGAKKSRETYLGKMADYLDQMVYLIVGGPPEPTSAEVKVDNAGRKAKETLQMLAQERIDIETIDPNTTGLIQIIEKLKTKLGNTTAAELALKERFEQLQNRFDDAMTVGFEKEQKLLAEREKYQKRVDDIKRKYDELEALMKQTTEQQVQTLMVQRDEARDNYKKLNQELLRTQAQLKETQDRVKRVQQELWKIKPPPDREVTAFKPDGKIMWIDNQVVHLNIGSNDRVYRGLTFSVYDKGMPIPRNGRGKAEIEVFDVGKNVSMARIIRSVKRRPIVLDDIVANLIWDSDRTNVFVIAGEFDLNSDGDIDYDAVDKIKVLIEKWGGRVAYTVSIDTDFLVLGRPPQVLRKPTAEEMEVDPMAMEKYYASLQRLADYNQVQSQAQALWVPIFKAERFLYFIGYKALAGRPGAF